VDVKMEEIEAQLGTNGILLRVSKPRGGAAVGRLRVGKAKLRWAKGRARTYKEIPIEDFVDWLDQYES
jgi:hypothetical protein